MDQFTLLDDAKTLSSEDFAARTAFISVQTICYLLKRAYIDQAAIDQFVFVNKLGARSVVTESEIDELLSNTHAFLPSWKRLKELYIAPDVAEMSMLAVGLSRYGLNLDQILQFFRKHDLFSAKSFKGAEIDEMLRESRLPIYSALTSGFRPVLCSIAELPVEFLAGTWLPEDQISVIYKDLVLRHYPSEPTKFPIDVHVAMRRGYITMKVAKEIATFDSTERKILLQEAERFYRRLVGSRKKNENA